MSHKSKTKQKIQVIIWVSFWKVLPPLSEELSLDPPKSFQSVDVSCGMMVDEWFPNLMSSMFVFFPPAVYKWVCGLVSMTSVVKLWGVCWPNRRYINISPFTICEKSKRKEVRNYQKLDLFCESMDSTCDPITRNGCECEQTLRGGLLSHWTMLTHPSVCSQIALLHLLNRVPKVWFSDHQVLVYLKHLILGYCHIFECLGNTVWWEYLNVTLACVGSQYCG